MKREAWTTVVIYTLIAATMPILMWAIFDWDLDYVVIYGLCLAPVGAIGGALVAIGDIRGAARDD